MSGADASGAAPGWRIATLRGVPVYLGRSWPIIFVVIVAAFGPPLQRALPDLGAAAYLVAALYAVLLLMSVLVHEASHAIMGQARGYRVSRIVADLWGGHTAYEHADTSPASTALVAVVGPISNGVIALGAWLLLPVMPYDVPHLLVAAVAVSNAFVAGFNLLPGLPLDGGYLVDALVWKITGSRSTGMVVAGWCGRVVTVLVLAWALLLPLLRGESPSLLTVAWAAFLGTFLWVGASSSVRAGTARRLVDRVPLRSVVRPLYVVADSTPLTQLDPRGGSVAVHNPENGVWGLVDPAALELVPATARARTTAGSVARAQPVGWVVQVPSLDADVTPVIQAVHASGAEELAVITQERPPSAGLVTVRDLAAALERADGTA
ncbi:peptidase M50 [Luteipulveratus sp. YIM 133132]|uniref:peptidase M50 n=1 Tax=Luteipulveratus flavus TaxID=3031728 RepID=UPI0023AE7E47|nr:peptidase M50 [Luteipulveratus sp. YIM 133132]MDE9367436.1 peptidase M50 [Luteipulveratus sp. YIM 133132]